MQITGIILSGGLSTRMGTDKALIELKGISLLENAIGICQKYCDQILISSDNPEHQNFGYKTIADEYKNSGPLSGIYSCLKESKNDWNFILSVDAAFVPPDFVYELLKNTYHYDAVIPFHTKGKEPLISMFNKSALPVIMQHLEAGNFKLHNLISNINANLYQSQAWMDTHPRIFDNLNSPEDL